MGSTDEDHSRKPRSLAQSKLKIFFLVLSTNILSIYLCTIGPLSSMKWPTLSVHHCDSRALLHELNETSSQLSASHVLSADLHKRLSASNELSADLHKRLSTSNSLLETLLKELGKTHIENTPLKDGLEQWQQEATGDLKLILEPQKLPFGFTANIGSDELYPVLGSGCWRLKEEVSKYMSYIVGGECPSDDVFAQKLMLKGCEPLPRRRCHPKSPVGYVEATPLPESLWSTPADTSVIWDPYTCKNYTCLVNRKQQPGSYDCKDCFDLNGREKSRWLYDNGDLDYGMDEVLRTKQPGTIRIGLDIGGGSGTFAARMKERNITIVTTSMNFDGPFNSFIASRGLVPMYFSIAHRLPFFDNTLDIVHSMHVLSNWIPDIILEFALYDIYRVLRPGGLFWLDHFFCFGSEINFTHVPMFENIGFNKLRWNAGRKLDRGVERNEWYISALLEKPMTET